MPDFGTNPGAADGTPAALTVVAMSGGVDSSTVAALLHGAGRTVVGLTMQLWNQRRLAGRPGMPETSHGRCCSLEDVHDARRVAEQLGIPYYVVNYEQRFEQDVVRNFVAQYRAGRTPIPCSLCNTSIKFDALTTTARQIGATRVATGHYARITPDPERPDRRQLRRAADRQKDQTYFLWGLTQDQLATAEFPLGELQKDQVRRHAAAAGLAVAAKPESYEICFVPGNDYAAFLDAYAAEQGMALGEPGETATADGQVLGRHPGVHHFTVGQRKGLGVATGQPLYVLNVDAGRARVVVGEEAGLYHRELIAERTHWIAGAPPAGPLRLEARIRHRHQPAAAWAEALADGRLRLEFDVPQRAITPGQAVVLYQEDLVLGGAWIVAAGSDA
ncbi:MAG: tRNA 2-thiouridine(34) synthase MnmA [Terriglobales bacterium]